MGPRAFPGSFGRRFSRPEGLAVGPGLPWPVVCVASVVVAVNDAARAWGVSANLLVRTATGLLGGSGGGKDDVAQGGGTDLSRVEEALRAVEHEVGRAATTR